MIPNHIVDRIGRCLSVLDQYIEALKTGVITTPQRFVWGTEGWQGYFEYAKRASLKRVGQCGLQLEITSDGYLLYPSPGVLPLYPKPTHS